MEISVNFTVRADGPSPSGGPSAAMTFAEDYILGCHWNGRFPINPQEFAHYEGLKIGRPEQDLEDAKVPGCKWVYYRPEKSWLGIHQDKPIQIYATIDDYIYDYELELEVAFILQWHVRKEDPRKMDPESQKFKNGWKIAKHILMPAEVFYKIGPNHFDMLKNLFRHIPEEEVRHRFNKVLQR